MRLPFPLSCLRLPARARLLKSAGMDFESMHPNFKESALKQEMAGEEAEDVAMALARSKAAAVSALYPAAMVLGGDQMLAVDGRWLTKPKNRAGLKRQISDLQGRSHHLHSAAVLMRGGRVTWQGAETAHLTMRALCDEDIEAYVAAAPASVLGCVGGYEIEGLGVTLFEKIEGDMFTIQGLPLLSVLAALREIR